MIAILLQLLLLFLYKCVFAYVIRIVDLSFGLNIFLFGNIYRYKDNTHI